MKFKACYILKSNVVLSCNRVRVVSNLGERKVRSNISNTRKSVSSDIQTLRSKSEKRGAAEFFLENFKVFEYLMKHSFECLI